MSVPTFPAQLVLTIPDVANLNGVNNYKIVALNPQNPEIALWYVFRPYYQIDAVIRKLAQLKPDPPLPKLPPMEKKSKGFFGSLFGSSSWKDFDEPSSLSLEGRRQLLERCVQMASMNKILVADDDFLRLVGFNNKTGIPANSPAMDVIENVSYIEEPRTDSTSGKMHDIEVSEHDAHWLRYKSVSLKEEENTRAAYSFIRSTNYRILSVLPPLAYHRPGKTNLLVTDEKSSLLLSVYRVSHELSKKLEQEKPLSHFIRLLDSLNTQDFLVPLTVRFEAGYVFVVRNVVKGGSLNDKLYGAQHLQLEHRDKKYANPKLKPKPFSTTRIAKYGYQIARLIQRCHEYNIALSNLSLGNFLVTGKDENVLKLTDIESVILHTSPSPVVLPYSESPSDAVTHIDILRFGICLIEMALGLKLSHSVESALLQVNGKTWMPNFDGPPADTEEDDEEHRTENDLTSQAELRNIYGPAKVLLLLPQPLPAPGKDEGGGLRDVIIRIFTPRAKVEPEALLGHSYFSSASKKCDGDNTEMKLKKKDLEFFYEAREHWAHTMSAWIEQVEREKEARRAARELRQKFKSEKKSSVQMITIKEPESEAAACEKEKRRRRREVAVPESLKGVLKPSTAPLLPRLPQPVSDEESSRLTKEKKTKVAVEKPSVKGQAKPLAIEAPPPKKAPPLPPAASEATQKKIATPAPPGNSNGKGLPPPPAPIGQLNSKGLPPPPPPQSGAVGKNAPPPPPGKKAPPPPPPAKKTPPPAPRPKKAPPAPPT